MTALSCVVEDVLRCCGSERFAKEMVSASPFADLDHAVRSACDIWFNKAFAAHPAIGAASPSVSQWSMEEQSAAMPTANDSASQELVEWNFRYREKFGFVFLICASGRGTTEILAELKIIVITLVLDVARGSPASGVEVHLEMWKGTHQHPSFTNRESTHRMLIGSLITNTDGRSGPLMGVVDHITPVF